MWPFLGKFLGFLTGLGPIIGSLGGKIVDLQQAKVQAESDKERAYIQKEIEEVQARQAAFVAEAGSRVGAFFLGFMQVTAAFGPIAYLTKMLAWDKVMGSFYGCAGEWGRHVSECKTFVTDPIDENMWWVVTAVIAFLFVASKFKRQ
jgi:hypothetical protein